MRYYSLFPLCVGCELAMMLLPHNLFILEPRLKEQSLSGTVLSLAGDGKATAEQCHASAGSAHIRAHHSHANCTDQSKSLGQTCVNWAGK